MYKLLTKYDWLKIFDLPKDYTIDALLVSGVAYKDREIEIFNNVLSNFPKFKDEDSLKDSFFKQVRVLRMGEKKIWFDTVYGGTYLSELTHIACMLGSKANILVGSCGGLQNNLQTGDLIIPTYSYGDDSVTRTYQKENLTNKHIPSKKLTQDITGLIKQDITMHEGPIITCQAMMGETKEQIDEWERDGYLGVEMESATLFAVSNSFNVDSTAILHVSDNLIRNELVGGKTHTDTKEIRDNIRKYKYEVILKYFTQSIK